MIEVGPGFQLKLSVGAYEFTGERGVNDLKLNVGAVSAPVETADLRSFLDLLRLSERTQPIIIADSESRCMIGIPDYGEVLNRVYPPADGRRRPALEALLERRVPAVTLTIRRHAVWSKWLERSETWLKPEFLATIIPSMAILDNAEVAELETGDGDPKREGEAAAKQSAGERTGRGHSDGNVAAVLQWLRYALTSSNGRHASLEAVSAEAEASGRLVHSHPMAGAEELPAPLGRNDVLGLLTCLKRLNSLADRNLPADDPVHFYEPEDMPLLPATLYMRMPVLADGPPRIVEARLSLRLRDNQSREVRVTLPRPADIEDASFHDLIARIRSETKFPVIWGSMKRP